MSRQDGQKLLNTALEDARRKYRKRLAACRKTCNEDNVHQLRVSIRKLLSLIDLLHLLLPNALPRKLRKTLKAQLDGFDELRDTQVMLQEVTQSLPQLPALMPFIFKLQHREQRLLQQSRPLIAQRHKLQLRRLFRKATKALRKQADLKQAAFTTIDSIHSRIVYCHQTVDATNLHSIHQLRIALKKLRYLLPALQNLHPELPSTHIKRLQNYLTLLGDIQNSAVLAQALAQFFTDPEAENIHQYYRQQQQSLLTDFSLRREEALSFWRLNPELAHPWESNPA